MQYFRHKERDRIEEGLLEGRTLREVARRYGVSKSALLRRRDAHLAARMAAGLAQRRAGETAAGEELWGRLKWMHWRTTSLVLRTERKRPAGGDRRAAAVGAVGDDGAAGDAGRGGRAAETRGGNPGQ